MIAGWVTNHWNDALTIATFLITLSLGYYQIKYYRGQTPSLEISDITDAEYRDFDKETEYEFTVQLQNDGRDPVSIPNVDLEIEGEDIEVYTDKEYTHIGPSNISSGLPDHRFNTIRLGSNEFEHVKLFGFGDAVDTRGELTGELSMETSVGDKDREITFERAP